MSTTKNSNLRLNDAMHVVYARYCHETGKTYYGSTSDLDSRMAGQAGRARSASSTTNLEYYTDLLRYEFETTILATVRGKEAALELERHYTNNHPKDACYNILNSKQRRRPEPYSINEAHRVNWTAEGKDRLERLRDKVIDLYHEGVTVNEMSRDMLVSKSWIYSVLRDSRRAGDVAPTASR